MRKNYNLNRTIYRSAEKELLRMKIESAYSVEGRTARLKERILSTILSKYTINVKEDKRV